MAISMIVLKGVCLDVDGYGVVSLSVDRSQIVA